MESLFQLQVSVHRRSALDEALDTRRVIGGGRSLKKRELGRNENASSSWFGKRRALLSLLSLPRLCMDARRRLGFPVSFLPIIAENCVVAAAVFVRWLDDIFILVVRHDRPRSRAWRDESVSRNRSRNSLATRIFQLWSIRRTNKIIQYERKARPRSETEEQPKSGYKLVFHGAVRGMVLELVWKQKPHVTHIADSSSPLR